MSDKASQFVEFVDNIEKKLAPLINDDDIRKMLYVKRMMINTKIGVLAYGVLLTSLYQKAYVHGELNLLHLMQATSIERLMAFDVENGGEFGGNLLPDGTFVSGLYVREADLDTSEIVEIDQKFIDENSELLWKYDHMKKSIIGEGGHHVN